MPYGSDNCLAGRDASRALALMSLKVPTWVLRELMGLPDPRKQIASVMWKESIPNSNRCILFKCRGLCVTLSGAGRLGGLFCVSEKIPCGAIWQQ